MKNILSDIRNFVQGNFNFIYHEHNAPHINEQAEWRAYKCQDCLKAGKCRHCGCKTPNMFYAPNKTDSAGKWGRMLSQHAWEEFKNSDAEYQLFSKVVKVHNKQENASTELYRQQQELLGYTPPLTDPIPEYYQTRRQEEFIGNTMGNSSNAPSEFPVLQPSIQREESPGNEGASSQEHGSVTILDDGKYISGTNLDSGTETSPSMEEEAGGEKQID